MEVQGSTSTADTRAERSVTSAPLQRADELLRQTTVDEKAMQVSSVNPMALIGPDRLMRDQLDSLIAHHRHFPSREFRCRSKRRTSRQQAKP